MGTFRSTLQVEVDVNFHDEEKAKEFFIDGDWKKYFFEFLDLRDAAEHLSFVFQKTDSAWSEEKQTRYKNIKGFGNYYFNTDDRTWEFLYDGYDDELNYGNVTVKCPEDLECTDVAFIGHDE